jgi:hypothetical protein
MKRGRDKVGCVEYVYDMFLFVLFMCMEFINEMIFPAFA